MHLGSAYCIVLGAVGAAVEAAVMPDHRRAHELRLELEAALQELAQMQCDGASEDDIRQQREALHYLHRALFLCGVPEPQP